MAGQFSVFSATDGVNGQELWITDGTDTNTRLLKDIYPGAVSSSPGNFTSLGNGQVIFTAIDPTNGAELWVTDGTIAGTQLVKDINPGTSGSNQQSLASIGNGRALFTAANGTNGNELWVTDGTPAGTTMLKDIYVGSAGSFPNSFTLAANGKYVFQAQDATNGNELWVTDGTPAGTTFLKDTYTGTTSGAPFYYATLGNGKIVFTANNETYGRELWITDGTVAGTTLLKDIVPGSTGSFPVYSAPAPDGRVFFSADNGTTGQELWVTDGTTSGTTLLKDLNPGSTGSSPLGFVSLGNGKTVFQASDATAGRELWVTDGTANGTMLLKDINPGTAQALFGQPVVALGNGTALFQANDAVNGSELWITDGTPTGTKVLVDINPGAGSSSPLNLQADGAGGVYFTATDATSSGALWYTDGTVQGTHKVSSISTTTSSSSPSNLTLVDSGKALFTANDPTTGSEVWVTDGTANGTSLVKDINSGSGSSSSVGFTSLGNGRTIFQANDGTNGTELWVTDGTANGTSLVKDINPGANNSNPTSFTSLGNGMAVFSADNGTDGSELWVTDGTTSGTSLVKDIFAGSNGSAPTGLTSLGNGKAVFSAGDANTTYGTELWVTDGTANGTSLLKDIYAGVSSSGPMNLVSLGNGKALFTAVDATNGREAWVTDGTANGTFLLKDIYSGTITSVPSGFTSLGDGKAVFSARDATNGAELWVTDGTANGTILVKDIVSGTPGSSPTGFASLGNGTAIFSAQDTGNGRELWVTDGTSNGTSLVKNIAPGSASSTPTSLTSLGNGKVVFSATDGTTGAELWVTDGTANGTMLVKDIYPGSAASNPTNFRSLGNGKALFSATDPINGTELWITDGTAAGTTLVKNINTQAGSSNASGFAPVMGPTTPSTPVAPTMTAASDSGVQGDGITSDTTPTVTGTADVGATVTLYDTDGTTVLGTTTTVDGTYSITSTALAEGTHTLKVTATNADGIASAASPGLSFEIDTTAPEAPAITLTNNSGDPTDTITNDPALTFTKTDAADTLVYSLDNLTYASTAPTFATDGIYTVYGKEIDAAGNRSATSSLTFTLDTTADTGSDLAVSFDAGNAAVPGYVDAAHAGSASFTIVGLDPGATAVVTFNGIGLDGNATSVTSTQTASGSYTVDLSGFRDGAITASIGASDAAGNIAAGRNATTTLDATPPAAPAGPALTNDTGSAGDRITSDASITYPAPANGETLLYSIDGTTYSATAPAFTSDGTYTVAIKLQDAAGNQSTTSSLTFTLDTAAPGTPSAPTLRAASDTGLSSTDGITRAAAPVFVGTAEAGATVTLYNGTNIVCTGVAGADGSYTIGVALGEGTYSLGVTATDPAGNTSGASASLPITIDRTAPGRLSAPTLDAASDTGAADGITANATPTFAGTAEEGDTITLYAGTTRIGAAVAGAGGRYTVSPSSALADGVYMIRVSATDVAGNAGGLSSTATRVVIDTVAATPSVPQLTAATDTGGSPSDGVTKANAIFFTGTAEAGATVRLFNGSTMIGSGTASTTGSYSIGASLAEGEYAISATATDLAGNTSLASGTRSVTVDRTAPARLSAPTLASDTGAADGITSTATPTFTGTAEAGSTITLYNGTTTKIGTAVAGSDGRYSVTSSTTLTDGVYMIRVAAIDLAGNVGGISSTATRIVIDTQAPAAPAAPVLTAASDSGASSSDAITSVTTPTITGTAEAGATVKLYDTDGTTLLGSAVASSAGAYSIRSSALVDGAHTLTVKAQDVAGNTSVASPGLGIEIDTSAPAAPSIALANDTGAADNVSTDATLTYTRSEMGNALVYSTDGTIYASTAPTFATDGTYTVYAKEVDAAGNQSTASSLTFTLDRATPNAPSTPVLLAASDTGASSTDGITKAAAPVFTGFAEAGATVRLYDGSTLVATKTAETDGSYIIGASLSEGDHALSVTATDLAGNTSVASAIRNITIDRTAPATPPAAVLDPSSDTGSLSTDNVTSDNTPTFTGTATAGTTVTLYDGTTSIVGSAVAGTDGSYAITTSALADGVRSVRVVSTDVAGNSSGLSVGRSLTVDTQAPPVAITNGGGSVASAQQTINGTGEYGSRLTLTNNGTSLGTITVGASGTWSRSVTLSSGQNDLVASAVDRAGNQGASQIVSFDYAPPGAGMRMAAFAPPQGDVRLTHALFDAALAPGHAESAPPPAAVDPAIPTFAAPPV